ncbi:MAG: hypothetical protein R3C59_30720 [Planctomycetaceae bacterium]
MSGSIKATEGEAMLRKGIVALMITVMGVSGLQAADGKNSSSLLGIFRGPANGRTQQRPDRSSPSGGVTHAVVEDADRQVPEIRQTSAQPPRAILQPAAAAPQPTPVAYAPPGSGGPIQFPSGDGLSTEDRSAGQSTSTVGLTEKFPPQGYYILPFSQHLEHHHHLPNGGYLGGVPVDGSAGPLYPAPKPGIPQQVGGTAFVHQAFHPHEMLYAHRYKSMYGPYYYKVDGGWMLTPFGVWSKENWKLQGTTVDVKYKSHISPFAMFHRPIVR